MDLHLLLPCVEADLGRLTFRLQHVPPCNVLDHGGDCLAEDADLLVDAQQRDCQLSAHGDAVCLVHRDAFLLQCLGLEKALQLLVHVKDKALESLLVVGRIECVAIAVSHLEGCVGCVLF